MKIIDRILSNKILKNSLVLINGTIISQIVNVLISPIMSRMYSPDDFGRYSAINAIIVLLTVIANGKYDLAIMNSEEDDGKRKATYHGGMILTIITCLIVFIGGIILRSYTTLIVSYSVIDILAIAMFTFFASNNSIINIWLNKNGFYKQIARNRMIYAISHALGIIAFGILHFSYMGIILSVLIAYILQFAYVYVFLYKKTSFFKYKFDFKETISQLKKHSNFPKFQMPSLLLNSASTQVPVILFKEIFSTTIAGWYSMTVKVINLPMNVVGSALGEVYFKEACDIKASGDEKRLSSFTYNTFKKLMLIGLLPMGVLFAYGDILFEFVLGEEWRVAGIYARYLAPWYFIVFVTSPFTHLFTILNKQKNNLILNVIMLLSRIISIVAGYLIFNGDSSYTIICFAITGFLIWTMTNGYLFKMVNISYKKTVLQTIILFVITCIIFYIPRIIIGF